MQAHLPVIVMSLAWLTGLVIITCAALKGWEAWLALKRLELQAGGTGSEMTTSGARIELADLKERIRKLEAIASGVDLLP